MRSFVHQYPARVVAMAGATLLALGALLGSYGLGVFALGILGLVLASVAGLGARGDRVCLAYQRSGMAAVDGMTSRQFSALLERYFVTKGCRVSRRDRGGPRR